MRNIHTRGKCEKKKLSKCMTVFRAYSEIQIKYGDVLEKSETIKQFQVNVPLEGLRIEGEYSSDFVCTKKNGETMVRECVFKKYLTKPLTIKTLDASRNYWLSRGVTDWGIVIDE